MKPFRLFALLALSAMAAAAQGVRMSSDFFPLAPGNRWAYAVTGGEGQKLADTEFAVEEHRIISGRSFYLLTGFPFVSDPNEKIRLVGYDRQEREFVRIVNAKESALFPADGAATDMLEQDNAGLPQKIRLRLDTMTLTFQRGVGIVEARLETANGRRLLTLIDARVGEAKLSGSAASGPALATAAPQRQAAVVSAVTADNPQLRLEAAADAKGIQMALTVVNTSDKLLAFRFASGQTYDFVISNASGQQIWKWSEGQYFTAVVRSEALRMNSTWKFEALWNGRDNGGKPVAPGDYRLLARLTSQPPLESKPVSISLP